MAKTKPPKQMPETIYVVQEEEEDCSWLTAQEDVADLVNGEDDPPVTVGTYVLVGTRKLRKSFVVIEEEDAR